MKGLSDAQRMAISAALETRASVPVHMPRADLDDMLRRGLIAPLGTVGSNGLDDMRVLPLSFYVKGLDDAARGPR